MRGTAPVVDFWILIEYKAQWSRDAVVENDLPDQVKSWLEGSVDALKAKGRKPRVQFIRRDRTEGGPLQLFVCESSELRTHTFGSYSELTDVSLEEDVAELVQSNHYFVCSHASRDLCCSRYGLATWRRLHELSGGRSWQSTHLGGHRFAPNVLVLPQARLYGRVHLPQVERFFKKVEKGEVDYDLLRGKSEFPSEAQVCECLVEAAVESVASYDSNSVRFHSEKGEIEVSVPPSDEIPVIASCGDAEPKLVRQFSDT